ncbi:MAG: hypothetical protein ACKVH8_02290 [Pirellulales bacterium]
MACGHTDDVPNVVEPEVTSTPESSAVLHDIKALGVPYRCFVKWTRVCGLFLYRTE